MAETAPGGPQIDETRRSAHRLKSFSEIIIAVVISLVMLELGPPAVPGFAALLPLWQVAMSYAVSYGLIAIIWINHHHLRRLVMDSTPRLILSNFLHLFLVASIPFATQWVAETDLGPATVSLYAGLFVCIDSAFLLFVRQVMAQADCTAMPDNAKRHGHRRSLVTLVIFAAGSATGYFAPLVGIGLILVVLSFFLRLEVPWMPPAGARRPTMTGKMDASMGGSR
jgi:uncharacterized membrane protein